MATIRVATTITNVTPGSIGEESSHLIAAMDALTTARKQVKLAIKNGQILSQEKWSILSKVDSAWDAVNQIWMNRIDEEIAKLKKILGEL